MLIFPPHSLSRGGKIRRGPAEGRKGFPQNDQSLWGLHKSFFLYPAIFDFCWSSERIGGADGKLCLPTKIKNSPPIPHKKGERLLRSRRRGDQVRRPPRPVSLRIRGRGRYLTKKNKTPINKGITLTEEQKQLSIKASQHRYKPVYFYDEANYLITSL